MARLFNGESGTSSYNAVTAKFDEVNSLLDPVSGDRMIPYSYADEDDFAKRVDLSIPGAMMDCGECHVGGGAMQYIPFTDLRYRILLRHLTTNIKPKTGLPYNTVQSTIDPGEYTAFNYFIDTYDVDEDGDKGEVQYMDYVNTGVMEMDCLLCHMKGYDYAKRTELLRDGRIDATRAVAAGLATEMTTPWPDGGSAPAGYGTDVVYDNSQFIVNNDGELVMPGTWVVENIVTVPDSNNCAFCHFNKPSVDWKKRGDNWAPIDVNGIPAIDGSYEVHYNLGCMGCHQRKPTALQPDPDGYTGVAGPPFYPLMGAGLLGHDPAKGDAPFSSLYNANDNAAFKRCEDCHQGDVEDPVMEDTNGDLIPDTVIGKQGEAYGAPNPNAAHAAFGLSAKIVQDAGMSGARISHIDLMACSACHSRKVDSYDWDGMGTGNNGNPMVDATGNDHEGRLTDHENDYIIKTDMTDRSGLGWYKGKLIRTSYLNTLFWRDKNDFGGPTGVDANMDGKPNGMDALLMTQVNKVNEANGWTSITYDNHGFVTDAMINARVTALSNEITAWTGATGTPDIKLSMMHVAFKDQHGVSPASMAWGSGAGNDPTDPADNNANPCLDCHAATANFYNGAVNTVGDGATMYWDDDIVPFTKVNGFTQATDMHPNVKDRFAVRSLASRVTTGSTDTDDDPLTPPGFFTTTPLDRAATMYEAAFMTKAPFVASFTSSAAIGFSGFEKGWLLRVQVEDQSDSSTIERTRMVSGDVTDVTTLLANLATGTDFTNNNAHVDPADNFNFVITDNTSGGITITAQPGYLIRLTGSGSAGAFQLTGAAWAFEDWTGVDGLPYAGRADWVAHLNDLSGTGAGVVPASFGIGVDPVAAILTVDGTTPVDVAPADGVMDAITVEVGAAVSLVADESVNTQGYFSYSWICNDTADETLEGVTASKTFDRAGTWTVTLRVLDEEDNMVQSHQTVVSVTPAAATTIAYIETPSGVSVVQTVTFDNLPAATEQLYIFWGDGQKERVAVADSGIAQVVTHQFRAFAVYDQGANFVYDLSVQAQELVDDVDQWGNPIVVEEVLEVQRLTITVTDDL